MTPEEAQDALTSTIEATAAQLQITGWNRDHASEGGNCGAKRGERVDYTFGYGAPSPDSDRAADARTVAEYWRSLGMSVRIVERPSYVV